MMAGSVLLVVAAGVGAAVETCPRDRPGESAPADAALLQRGSNLHLGRLAGPAAAKNVYEKVAGVGAWGGWCACPDGQRYSVGDNNDACRSLACEGGLAGTCQRK